MTELPTHATARSHELLAIAREIADRCPVEMAANISASGSVARGVADHYSDIEIDFWCVTLPTADAEAAWYKAIGATEVAVGVEPPPGQARESSLLYKGVRIEPAWQTMADVDEAISKLLAGETDEHGDLVLAEAISHAVTIRTTGWLTDCQRRLQDYPDAVQQRLIAVVTEAWANSTAVEACWVLVRREQYLNLSKSLLAHLNRLLRLLFALNREWEPDYKWIAQLQTRLSSKPADLMTWINTVLLDPDPEARLVTLLRLILDTLDLLPAAADVEAARSVISQSLADNGY